MDGLAEIITDRGEGFEQTMQHTSAWFQEHLPVR